MNQGQHDIVMLSMAEFKRVRGLKRRTMRVSELTEDELAAFGTVEIPAEAAQYDHEMT